MDDTVHLLYVLQCAEHGYWTALAPQRSYFDVPTTFTAAADKHLRPRTVLTM